MKSSEHGNGDQPAASYTYEQGPISVPSRLFKYQPPSHLAFENLRNHQLWFSKPADFNDPFDCAIRLDRTEPTEEDYVEVFGRYRADPALRQILDANYQEAGAITPKFRAVVRDAMKNAFERRTKEHLHNRGICCLSEVGDDILMWGHYSAGHRGFCLEFDTSSEPFSRAMAVRYSKDIPSVNPARVLLDDTQGRSLLPMILTKAACWSYEREWRILDMQPDTLVTYPNSVLAAVHLGTHMSRQHRDEVVRTLRRRPTHIYELSPKPDEFSFDSARRK